MGVLDQSAGFGSPIQQHQVSIANDVQWITGNLKSLGNPYNYINQEDLDTFILLDAHIFPWSFSGLPASRTSQSIVFRSKTQFLLFPDPITQEQFTPSMRTSMVILQLSLAVIRGEAPFMSEASIENFLDYWKPTLFPMVNAQIHFLADCAASLPTKADVVYINRECILSYISG